ncbi:hypothetical protein DMH88_09955 [Escherichia coli]|nr:hypothetical protein [Escherichia coli]
MLKPIPARLPIRAHRILTGTAFLEQLLIMLTPDPAVLKKRRTMPLSPASLRPCGKILMHCIRICGAKERISRLRPRGWMLC